MSGLINKLKSKWKRSNKKNKKKHNKGKDKENYDKEIGLLLSKSNARLFR